MSIIHEFFGFLRRPDFAAECRGFSVQSLQSMGLLLGFVFLTLPVIGIVMAAGFALSGQEFPQADARFEEMTNDESFLFLAILVAPVIEEVLFRSWLGSVRGLCLWLPGLLIALTAFIAMQSAIAPLIAIPILGGLAFAFYTVILRYKTVSEAARQRAARDIFPFLFWGSAALFGLVHLDNLQVAGMGPIVALAVLPQFVVGLVLGFVRMRFGLLSAIGFHGAYNGVLVGLSTMAPAII